MWGSTPTIIRPISLSSSRLSRIEVGEEGKATWSSGNPLLSHNLTTVPGRERSPKESHTVYESVGSRYGERPAEHLDTSLARPEP